jgi:hypothetical protein
VEPKMKDLKKNQDPATKFDFLDERIKKYYKHILPMISKTGFTELENEDKDIKREQFA